LRRGSRCRALSNGALVEGVADERRRGGAPDPARPLASPAQLRGALAALAGQRALAVLLVDMTDAAGSFLSRVRDLVGRNPVLLLGTKARARARRRARRCASRRGRAVVWRAAPREHAVVGAAAGRRTPRTRQGAARRKGRN